MRKVLADIYSVYRYENSIATEEEKVEGILISVKGGDGPNRPWILEIKIKNHPELNGRYIFGCSRPVGEVTNFDYHPNQEYGLLKSMESEDWFMVKVMHRKRK